MSRTTIDWLIWISVTGLAIAQIFTAMTIRRILRRLDGIRK